MGTQESEQSETMIGYLRHALDRRRQLCALDASVQKWAQNVHRAKKDKSLATSADDCPLCLLYHNDCKQCPVLQASGQPHCSNTPYVWVVDALVDAEIVGQVRYETEVKPRLVLFCTCEHEFLTLLSQEEPEKAREVIQWMHDYYG